MAKKQSTRRATTKHHAARAQTGPEPAPLHVLFVEPRFPGKLGRLADWLVRKRGYSCRFAFHAAAPEAHWPASVGRGLELVPFNVGGVAREQVAAWSRHLERSLCYAYGAWEVIDGRRIRPVDAIVARSGGLGSSLFLPVTYPHIPILQNFDYFLQPRKFDLADADAAALPAEYAMWRRSATAMDLLELENGVVPWTQSAWQRDLFPPEYRADFHVIPAWVDCGEWSPSDAKPAALGGRPIDPETKVVSFAASALDRLRGFDRFVTLAARLIAARDDVVCIAAGHTTVERMLDVPHFGQEYAKAQLEAASLARSDRFRTLGRVEPVVLRDLFRRSNAHIDPSRVYPISQAVWEALACGAPIVAWDTPPARELLIEGETGLLADTDELLFEQTSALLDQPEMATKIGAAAAGMARGRLDCDVVMPSLTRLLESRVFSANRAPSTL